MRAFNRTYWGIETGNSASSELSYCPFNRTYWGIETLISNDRIVLIESPFNRTYWGIETALCYCEQLLGCSLLIGPIEVLKRWSLHLLRWTQTTFNRTYWGIETECLRRLFSLRQPFNRTYWGIETLRCLSLAAYSRLLIGPIEVLKPVRWSVAETRKRPFNRTYWGIETLLFRAVRGDTPF